MNCTYRMCHNDAVDIDGRCEKHPRHPMIVLPSPPQWTTDPPTEPGWYWVRQGHNQPIVAWVRALDGKLRVKLFGNAYDSDVTERMFIAWLRIEAPEPPK